MLFILLWDHERLLWSYNFTHPMTGQSLLSKSTILLASFVVLPEAGSCTVRSLPATADGVHPSSRHYVTLSCVLSTTGAIAGGISHYGD